MAGQWSTQVLSIHPRLCVCEETIRTVPCLPGCGSCSYGTCVVLSSHTSPFQSGTDPGSLITQQVKRTVGITRSNRVIGGHTQHRAFLRSQPDHKSSPINRLIPVLIRLTLCGRVLGGVVVGIIYVDVCGTGREGCDGSLIATHQSIPKSSERRVIVGGVQRSE